MEELAQEKKRKIIVPASYTFDPLTTILRKEGVLVKNIWPNIEPSQEEIDSIIRAIEEAADILKQKHYNRRFRNTPPIL
jgi:hypothetical protein